MADSSSWFKRLFSTQLGPVFALAFIFALFAIADHFWGSGFFVTWRNTHVMLSSASLIAVPALGMTIIIISAGIDLSAGTALTLCGTVLALTLKHSAVAVGEPGFAMTMLAALGLTVLTGCLCGFINGGLISATKVVPFIVTLGTMTIYLGIGQVLSEESTVYAPKENIPEWMNLCYTGPVADKYLIPGLLEAVGCWDVLVRVPVVEKYLIPGLLVPNSVIIAVVLSVAVSLLLRYTIFGRNVFALGSSESTARLCGIHVPMMIVSVYTLAGFFVAVGGLLYFSDVKNGNPSDGTGKELEIIAAVVLGGGSLSGGRGSILGTMVGALIITVIRSGCSQLSIPNTYTHIIIGAIIIIAVVVDQLRHGSPEWFFRMLPRKDATVL